MDSRELAESFDVPNIEIEPLISIVIPCFKGERYLAASIESCLSQTWENIEVVVVDDASPDNCHAIATEFSHKDARVRVIRHERNGGVASAFNTGFMNARGAFFTRLAQDDLFEFNAIAAMVQGFANSPGCGLVYADVRIVDESGMPQGKCLLPDAANALCWGNGLGVCVMWRREVWDRVGTFDSAFDAAEDFDYWARVAAVFPIAKVDGSPLLRFRCHDAMGSAVHTRKQEDASLRIRRRMFSSASFPTRQFWRRCRTLSHHYCSFAYDHSVSGDHWGAIQRIARSFLYWPFPYPRAYMKTSLTRVKLAATIVFRLLGIMGCSRKTAVAATKEMT